MELDHLAPKKTPDVKKLPSSSQENSIPFSPVIYHLLMNFIQLHKFSGPWFPHKIMVRIK